MLTHPNEDEYPAFARQRFHGGQSSRLIRLPFMETERKHDSNCESCALNPATQRSRSGSPGLQDLSARLFTIVSISIGTKEGATVMHESLPTQRNQCQR